jgi:hypothetical protein
LNYNTIVVALKLKSLTLLRLRAVDKPTAQLTNKTYPDYSRCGNGTSMKEYTLRH